MEGELKVLGFRTGLVLNLGTPQKPRAVTEAEHGTWAKSGPASLASAWMLSTAHHSFSHCFVHPFITKL